MKRANVEVDFNILSGFVRTGCPTFGVLHVSLKCCDRRVVQAVTPIGDDGRMTSKDEVSAQHHFTIMVASHGRGALPSRDVHDRRHLQRRLRGDPLTSF